MNHTTHGGYASTVVIERGVLAEDPEAYEIGLAAFLAAKKPINAAAREFCVRMYNELHRLNRLDHFEAMGIEDAATLPDHDYDQALEEASVRHRFAQQKVEFLSDLLGEFEDDEPFDDYGWEELLSFAQELDPKVRDLWAVFDNHAAFGGLGSASDEQVEAGHRRIIAVIEHAYGSLTAALRHRLATAQDHEALMAAALDSVEPPRTERERAARFAAHLIDDGFFERLARPRTAAYRTLVAMNDMFLSSQELGPDEPMAEDAVSIADPVEADIPQEIPEALDQDVTDHVQAYEERGTNPSDLATTAPDDPRLAAARAARQRIAERERVRTQHEQQTASTTVP